MFRDLQLTGPLSFLPRAVREPRNPVQALAITWLTTFIPSILLAGIIGQIVPNVPQPQFNVTGPMAVFMLAVFAPVVETLIMGTVLLVLLRLFSPTAAILLSALGWGIAHSLAAPTWGLVIWWPFLVLSTLFVAWRRHSLGAAFAMPMIAHGLHNLPTALLVAYGFNI
jgi:membrane protease YdiL (CAAX protease family)